MRFAVVAREHTPTNLRLAATCAEGLDGAVVDPVEALAVLEPGDVALGRLDVLPSLDGVDDGLWCLGVLEARGVTVLNPVSALLGAHDKLLTSRLLARAGVPHPRTTHLRPAAAGVEWRGPVVVKPRYGSWGREVERHGTPEELAARIERLRGTPWFERQGALVQDLVPPVGHDLRLVVAGGRVVGCVRRECAPGEWRTNVALGARRVTAHPPVEARRVAARAAAALRADFVGVDLLPTPDGAWTVAEVNGAVEISDDYADRYDVFERSMAVLVHATRRAATLLEDVALPLEAA